MTIYVRQLLDGEPNARGRGNSASYVSRFADANGVAVWATRTRSINNLSCDPETNCCWTYDYNLSLESSDSPYDIGMSAEEVRRVYMDYGAASRRQVTLIAESAAEPVAAQNTAEEAVSPACDSCGTTANASRYTLHGDTLEPQVLCLSCLGSDTVPASLMGRFHRVAREAAVPVIDRSGLNLYCTPAWRNVNAYPSVDDNWYVARSDRDAADRTYEEHDRDDDSSEESCVYDYHETNNILLFGWPRPTPKDSLCFGVELEMEAKQGHTQQELSELLGGRDGSRLNADGSYLLMRDGSLDNESLELITSPYTLDFHQNAFKWQELLAPLLAVADSGRRTTNCGMHVHVNRKAISALTLGKLLVFVNSDAATSLITRVAQRDGERWARRYKKKIKDGALRESDKYDALHLSSNTVEFRIFRGNLRYDRVLKNIEFCHSAVMFSKTASMQEVSTPTAYLQWLNKNRGIYPNLVRFLGESYGFKSTAQSPDRTIER